MVTESGEKQRQLSATCTSTVIALAALGPNGRSEAITTNNTANRSKNVFMTVNITSHNCGESLAGCKTAKVTRLLLSPKPTRVSVKDRGASMRSAGVDHIANVTHGANERWIADPFSQTSNEHFHQLRVILVGMFPNAFAEFGACKDASRLPH